MLKRLDKSKEVTYATLATLHAQGHRHGRPLHTCEPGKDGALWFFTEKDARKISEVKANSQVGLGYSGPNAATCVTVAGTATVVEDKQQIKDLWREDCRGFFAKGTDDPNIALLRVASESGGYRDAPSNVFGRAFAYAKAITTGQKHQPTPDEQANGQV